MTSAHSTFRAEDLSRLEVAANPVIRPDGLEVAYQLQRADAETDSTISALWLVSVAAESSPRRLTSGPADSEQAWWALTRVLTCFEGPAGSVASNWCCRWRGRTAH